MSASAVNLTVLDMCSITPSATNPRRSMDPVALAGLCESIREVGLQNPIIVRPDADGYEIVAGHRRYAAYEKLGREEIPAIVRELTDEECREAQLVDNVQRADLDLVEECAAYLQMQGRLGTPAAIAQRVGKSVAHVTGVLQLAKLTDEARMALGFRVISFDHALLLAKLAGPEQEKALRWTMFGPFCKAKEKTAELVERARKELEAADRDHYFEPKSVLELKRYIEHEIRLELKRAPWALDDAGLVASAGACMACPKNTAANDALFGGLAIESARCMDSVCFEAKWAAFVQLQVSALERGGKDAVRISWARASAGPRMAKDGDQPKMDQVFKRGQWVEAKRGACEHVVTGVAVDYGDGYGTEAKRQFPGAALLVCVAAHCSAHPKDWEGLKPGTSRGGYDAKAEKEERAKKAEACKAENVIRMRLAEKAVGALKAIPDEVIREIFRKLAPWQFEKLAPRWAKALESSPVRSREFAEAAATVWLDGNGLQVAVSGWSDPADSRKEFLAALKLLGVDGASAWAKPSPQKTTKEVSAGKRQSGRKGAEKQPRPAAKKAQGKATAKAQGKSAPKKGAKR